MKLFSLACLAAATLLSQVRSGRIVGTVFDPNRSVVPNAKQCEFNDRMRLQFRAEAFNLTNTPSFSAPGTNIDLASGGIVTSTISTPRNIQFGLKLNF